MNILRRFLCFWVAVSFLGTSITVPSAHAQSSAVEPSGLPFSLPKPGRMVSLSPAFEPVLIKGLKVHPDDPFIFDFIVDPGNEKLNRGDLKKTSQRMVNYFLASLAVPEKDLWVNLSPVEKGHIIPGALNKTELGRDLLAEDYMLKQVTASLIYPESSLGKTFWNKVYSDAYRKLGVTQIPVNVFNKVWILPEKASVIEHGNTVFIVNAHLKVMLEEDYLAQSRLGHKIDHEASNAPVKDLSKQVMRQIILPEIEKEVNEGKNFSQLRQVFYSLILAQWYQDVFKQSILNKDYSGRNKVRGIDLNDPKNKERIYQQYLSAYKKGVFNYIKEETDQLTQQSVPRKYFSGGFVGQKVKRERASGTDIDGAMAYGDKDFALRVDLKPSFDKASTANPSQSELPEYLETWRNDLTLPLRISEKLQALLGPENLDQEGLRKFLVEYSAQVDHEIKDGNPVQGSWPIEKAVAKLKPAEVKKLDDWIEENYPIGKRTRLMEQLLLMAGRYNQKWLRSNGKNIVGRVWYFLSMEIDFKAGGLGPVNVTHSKFLSALGVTVRNMQPMYTTRFDTGKEAGEPLRYAEDLGFKNLKIAEGGKFDIDIGPKKVHVQVWEGENREGVPTYLIRDINEDGTSYYTKTLYMYNNTKYNPVSKEQSMAFFNLAAAKWISMQEEKREKELGKAYKLPVIHPQDGQMGLFLSVLDSHYPELSNAPSIDTTHTILNVGDNRLDAKGWFLKDMLGIIAKYIPASIMDTFFNQETGEASNRSAYVQHTNAGMQLSDVATGVSFSHAKDMSKWYGRKLVPVTNGDDPLRISEFSRQSFRELQDEGKIPREADYDWLSPEQIQILKERSAERFNKLKVLTANGEDLLNEAQRRWAGVGSLDGLNDEQTDELMSWANHKLNLAVSTREELRSRYYVNVDPKALIMGNARRLVFEKNNFDPDLIRKLVQQGVNVVLMGNYQEEASEKLAPLYKSLEIEINRDRRQARARGDNQLYPGKFFFVQHFTEEKKIALLGIVHGYFVFNKRFLGAHEITEENPGPNYAYMISLDHRDGGTTDWLIPVNFQKPGSGSLIMLKDGGSAQEWMNAGFNPWIKLWNEDKTGFFQNATLSMRMNLVQRGQLTAAGYIWAMDDFLEQQKQYRGQDRKTAANIIRSIKRIPDARRQAMKLIHSGPVLTEKEITEKLVGPFYFNHSGGSQEAAEFGLDGFLSEMKRVEDKYGYNALFDHLKKKANGWSNYNDFLTTLFRDAPEAQVLMKDWLDKWDNSPETLNLKNKRLQAFLSYLRDGLNLNILNPLSKSDTKDLALMADPGGIKLDHIAIERQGGLTTDIISDKELEGLLLNAQGVNGLIVDIYPIPSLANYIQ